MWIWSKIIIRVPSVTFIQIRYERYLTSLHEKLMRFLFRDMIQNYSNYLNVFHGVLTSYSPFFFSEVNLKCDLNRKGFFFSGKTGSAFFFFFPDRPIFSCCRSEGKIFDFFKKKCFVFYVGGLAVFDINNSSLYDSYVCKWAIAV